MKTQDLTVHPLQEYHKLKRLVDSAIFSDS
jgi:hypothetical protein